MLTGAQGFVAGSILAQAGDDSEVHAVSRQAEPVEPPGRSPRQGGRAKRHWHVCDPLAAAQLAQLFREVRPDVVIHSAALADIDYCQTHPELARAVNVELTRNLAELCAESGARLIFCSTDTIFDGEHAPYREEDPPGPVNLYAETKVQAEQIVNRLGAQAVIARLALVVGLPVLGSGNSFLIRMLGAFKEGHTVGMSEHEIRTPVDVITVGRALLELAASNHRGIFHLSGLSRVSRLELARTIAGRFGFPRELVIAQSAAAAPGRAARPRDVSLDNRKARETLRTLMRTLDEGISLILESEHARARA